MKKLLLILLCLPMIGFGQGWTKAYGHDSNEEGYSVLQTDDGGYVITGYTYYNTLGGKDVYIIKTDEFGFEQWSKKYGGDYDDNGRSIKQTNDGGYIVIGDIYNINSLTDIYLIKTDEFGDTLWTKTYGGNYEDYGRSIEQTNDGGYIITGYIDPNTTTPNQDLILIKTNSFGDSLWTKIINEPDCYWGYSVKQTSDNGFIIFGNTRPVVSSNGSFNGPLDVIVIKTDSAGNIVWEKKFGGGLTSERALSGQQTNDGGYIIGGYTSMNGDNMMMIKTDEEGDSLWSTNFGANSSEVCSSIEQTDDDGYILTGYTRNGAEMDVYLVKTDSVGNILWNKTFGDSGQDRAYSVQQTSEGGYIITGYTTWIPGALTHGGKDVWLIKTDGNGNITSTVEIPLFNSKRKLEKTINLQGQEVKRQTNQPYIEIYNDGSVEKKVIIE